MTARRFLIPSLTLAAVLTLGACGVDPTTVDAQDSPTPAGDALDPPDAPTEDLDPDPDPGPGAGIEPAATPVSDVPAVPAVEIVESTIVTGADATDAARATGEIGPDEQWELDFYVVEGATRWVDIDPAAVIGVYDCTQACEHVVGTLEHVLSGAPYGGVDALWSFVIGADGRATSAEELYLP